MKKEKIIELLREIKGKKLTKSQKEALLQARIILYEIKQDKINAILGESKK